MTYATCLWLFFVVVFGIIALPGLDMAYVMGCAIGGGTRRGMAAVGGIVAGGVCHVVMTALGIGMLIKLLPGLFNAVLAAGAAYLVWIGWSLLRSQAGGGTGAVPPDRPWRTTFRQGLCTNLLNPKAYLFMLAIFPQFMRPQYGTLWLQACVLWAIIALTQIGVYGGLVLTAGKVRHWLGDRPAAGVLATRCVGALLIGVAMVTGITGWRTA